MRVPNNTSRHSFPKYAASLIGSDKNVYTGFDDKPFAHIDGSVNMTVVFDITSDMRFWDELRKPAARNAKTLTLCSEEVEITFKMQGSDHTKFEHLKEQVAAHCTPVGTSSQKGETADG